MANNAVLNDINLKSNKNPNQILKNLRNFISMNYSEWLTITINLTSSSIMNWIFSREKFINGSIFTRKAGCVCHVAAN